LPQIKVNKIIAAAPEQVFRAVSDPESYAEAIEGVASVELLSELKSGVGARFRQNRLINKKELATEIEVTEFVENSRVRFRSNSSGCQWDTEFAVSTSAWPSELTITMDASAYKLEPTPINLHVMGLVGGAVEKDADALKAFCEKKP
jgi:uncharacterized protein YndB with AHSA1/START domain